MCKFCDYIFNDDDDAMINGLFSNYKLTFNGVPFAKVETWLIPDINDDGEKEVFIDTSLDIQDIYKRTRRRVKFCPFCGREFKFKED